MTKNWANFPKEETPELANFSAYQAYYKTTIGGYGVLTGCAVSRASSSSVAIASGTYTNNGIKKTYAGASLTSISAAASGKHRYDLVYIDGADDTGKIISGIEETPGDANAFLENYAPCPAQLTDTDWVVLAIVRVTESGIENTNFGSDAYATASIADIRMSPFAGVDDVTLTVDANGVLAVKAIAAGLLSGQIANSNLPATMSTDTQIIYKQITTPSAPSSGYTALYPKADGFYYRSAGGSETKIEGTGGTGTNGIWVVGETPSGSGTSFTLAHTPSTAIILSLNGQILTAGAGNDYTISGANITLAFSISGSDILLASYPYNAFSGFICGEALSPNGALDDFVLAHTPTLGVAIYVNGLRQTPGAGEDYTLSGDTITFTSAPRSGAKILVDYYY